MRTIEPSARIWGLRQVSSMGLVLGGVVALTTMVGCSGGDGAPVLGHVYKVDGTVVLNGGKPLSGGKIYFVKQDGSITSEGTIKGDGSFNLTTGNEPGAPEGDYKVRVEPEDATLLSRANINKKPGKGNKHLPFSRKYLDEDSSGLIAKVEPRENRIEPFLLK